MLYKEGLARRVRATLAVHDALDEKKMFGGLTFMLNGHMCCGIVRDELIMRVGSEQYADAVAQPHARQMDFTGRPVRGVFMVAPAGLECDVSLEAGCSEVLHLRQACPQNKPTHDSLILLPHANTPGDHEGSIPLDCGRSLC